MDAIAKEVASKSLVQGKPPKLRDKRYSGYWQGMTPKLARRCSLLHQEHNQRETILAVLALAIGWNKPNALRGDKGVNR
jgi:hypothetical protein